MITFFTLLDNPDVLTAVVEEKFLDAFQHFQLFGGLELRAPNEIFSPIYYVSNNPDVATAVNENLFSYAFQHYQLFGEKENRVPSSAYEGFEAETYLFANPDVRDAVEAGTFISALHHYISFGRFEGRPTSVSGMSFNFTGRIDTLVGTQGNDTFTSDPNTLQRGDSLKAAAGVDTLMVTLSSAQVELQILFP